MTFNVGETINQLADGFLRSEMVHKIARNPIYTALVIAFIIMLIVLIIFRDADTDDSLIIMVLRSGFWTFLFTCVIVFLHNKVLTSEIEDSKNVYNEVFDTSLLSDFKPAEVTPRTAETLSNDVI